MPPAFKDEAVRVKVPENIGSGFHHHGIGVGHDQKNNFAFDDDTDKKIKND